MPQQHPGRLQILVVDAHCKRRLFSTKTPTDPDELARRFCTPDNCLVVVLRDNRFLFRLERAPGSHCRCTRAAAPAISIYRTGYHERNRSKMFIQWCVMIRNCIFLFQRIKQLILLSLLF